MKCAWSDICFRQRCMTEIALLSGTKSSSISLCWLVIVEVAMKLVNDKITSTTGESSNRNQERQKPWISTMI